MKYCQFCGTENDCTARFCQHCGHQFNSGFATETPMSDSVESLSQEELTNEMEEDDSPANPSIKFCQRCGEINSIHASFCQKCATPFSGKGNLRTYVPNVNMYASKHENSVGFGDAISICFDKYACFEGRASRAEYWYFGIFCLLLFFASLILFAFIGNGLSDGDGETALGIIMFGVIIVLLGVLCPAISVTVRRLHDTGHSGWWYWINSIPYLGAAILMYFMVKKGDEGRNEYGLPASYKH